MENESNLSNASDYNSDAPRRKGNFPWMTVGLGVAAFYLISTITDGTKLPPLTDEDYDLLNTPASELQPLIQNDTSAVIFTVKGNTMTDAERAAALNAIHNKFSVEVNKLSEKLKVDPNILTNALTACMAIKDGTVREQSLALFFKFFDAWSTLFIGTVLAVGDGIAKITAATDAAILNARTCATWTFVKKTTYNVEQSSTTATSIQYTSSSVKIGLGLLGSGSSQGSIHTTINNNYVNESLVTEFIPTCTNTVVDPDLVFAIMSAHVISLTPLYDSVQLVADIAPKIESFVTLTHLIV